MRRIVHRQIELKRPRMHGGFGDVSTEASGVHVMDVKDQEAALYKLAQITEQAMLDPNVVAVARTLTNDCAGRDDMCELQAIFDAVKHGDERVLALRKGVRYVSDPRIADFFTTPQRLLQLCEEGACGEDCDGQASLVAALAGTLGFVTGLRGWGYDGEDELCHVYAVALIPKRDPSELVGLDTTVGSSKVGWEPPNGHAVTAWIY